MRQESRGIIRRKQWQTDQISKHDQHKEIIQVSSFLLHYRVHLMEQHSIHDLPDHFGRAFQFCREREE